MGSKINKVDLALIIAGIFFFTMFCVSSSYLLNYYVEGQKQEQLNAQLAELKHGKQDEVVVVEKKPVVLVQTDENVPVKIPDESIKVEGQPQETQAPSLSEINPDYVAWIRIQATVVDYPVVQRDNSYYLTHNFLQEKNKHGAIFLDENCTPEDDFLLIHGHHMKDGSMFGSLKAYKKKDYRQEHLRLSMEWETVEEQYTIFAGALVDLYNTERFMYEVLPKTMEEKEIYMKQLKKAAFWYDDIVWGEEDRFVILSTCDYGTEEERMILVARMQSK